MCEKFNLVPRDKAIMYTIVQMTGQRVTKVTLHTTRGEAVRKAMVLTDRKDARQFLRDLRKWGYVVLEKHRFHIVQVTLRERD
jgi:hypothetical protein